MSIQSNVRSILRLAACAGLLMVAAAGQSSAAEIRFLADSILESAMEELIPQFQQASGHTVKVTYAAPGENTERVRKGDPADVAIVSAEQWDGLQKDGKLAPGSRVIIARAGIALFVKKGAARPPVGSVDDVKRALMEASAISVADPKQSPVGRHLMPILERTKIAADIKPKLRLAGSEAAAIEKVAKGEAAIGLAETTEIMLSPDVEAVGPLPPESSASRPLRGDPGERKPGGGQGAGRLSPLAARGQGPQSDGPRVRRHRAERQPAVLLLPRTARRGAQGHDPRLARATQVAQQASYPGADEDHGWIEAKSSPRCVYALPRRRIASASGDGSRHRMFKPGGARRQAPRLRSPSPWTAKQRSRVSSSWRARPSATRRRSRSGCGRRSALRGWRRAPGTSTSLSAKEPTRARPRRRRPQAAQRRGVHDHAGGRLLRRRSRQQRGGRAGLRAGRLPLAADLERAAARPLLGDAEGAPGPAAATSPSCPAATSSRETVSVVSPAISSSIGRTRAIRSPWLASQSAASATLCWMASRVRFACAASSCARACAPPGCRSSRAWQWRRPWRRCRRDAAAPIPR